jgi:hypothetical protein
VWTYPTARHRAEGITFDIDQKERKAFARPLQLAEQRPLAHIEAIDTARVRV